MGDGPVLPGWRPLLARPVTMADLLRKGPFSGQGFHLRTSVCAFHFLSRGSKLSNLVKCQGPSDGQESIRFGGRSKSFLLPAGSGTLARYSSRC